MARQEKLPPSFSFPKEIVDEDLLRTLEERSLRVRSLRVAIAHQIEEEGLMLRNLTENSKISFPDGEELLEERKAAVDEYTFVGTLILETESAWQSGIYQNDDEFLGFLKGAFGSDRCRFLKEKKQVDLLKRDPSGFLLLIWWMNLGSKDWGSLRKEKKVALKGRFEGIRRYKDLYDALLAKGLPKDSL